MALTINNFWGAETGGTEELTSTTGSAAASVGGHSGTYAYQIGGSGEFRVDPFEAVTSAGSSNGFGFWFNLNPADIGAGNLRATIYNSDGTPLEITKISITGSGVTLYDSTGISLGSDLQSLTANTWHYIEYFFEGVDPGDYNLYLDGTQILNGTDGDFSAGTATAVKEIKFDNTHASLGVRVDDIYYATGANGSSSAADLLGGCEVFSYRSNKTSQLADRPASSWLNDGSWANIQEIPWSSGTTATAISTNQGGLADTNDLGGSENTGGPNTDLNITGTIVAAKWVFNALRSNGSSPTSIGPAYGKNNDSYTYANESGTLTTSAQFYSYVSEASTHVPTSSEYLSIGLRHSGDGGRNITVEDALAQILHVPAAAGAGIVYNPVHRMMPFLVR